MDTTAVLSFPTAGTLRCLKHCWLLLAPLWHSLLFDWCTCHVFLVTNPAFQVAVNHWQASPNSCCCFYHLLGCCFGHPTPRLLMLVALEAAPPCPHGNNPVPRQTEQNAPWLAPVAKSLQRWSPSCLHAGTTRF